MNKLFLLLTGAALVLAGCGNREQANTEAQIEPTVQAASAQSISHDPVTAQAQVEDQAVVSATPAVSTAGDMGPASDVIESASDRVDAGLAASAGAVAAAGTLLEGNVPALASGAADADTAGTVVADGNAAADIDLAMGKKVYGSNCIACHGTGAAGAPKLGDAVNWAPRIAKGLDVMTANALNGFQGSSGYMPAKGGFAGLSDAEVSVAVAYMASESH